MRCIGCGGGMRLVKAVADCTMMVSGYEHQTLECEGCHAVERRMVFGRTIGPLTVEPMPLPSETPPTAATETEQVDRIDPVKTWNRALERLRSTQSALKERAAAAMTSEAVREFRRTWEGFIPGPRAEAADRPLADSQPIPTKALEGAFAAEMPKPAAAKLSMPAQRPAALQRPIAAAMSANAGAKPGAAPTSALARVAAKLRAHQAMLDKSAEARPPQGPTFDEVWQGTRPSPGRPAQSIPRPLTRSRSLVPLDVHPEVASSLWARAVALLRGRQG